MTATKPLAVCITGPTAAGKTGAAVAVCRTLGGEVLSMDSMQVYRGFDIGTAKATSAEMQGVAHHLLSYVEPEASYTAADYQRDARAAMQDVRRRGSLPVFAGGTGLYLQSVSRPLSFTQAQGAGPVRAELEAALQAKGGAQALWNRLHALDPQRAQALHVNNTRRVIRALEVVLTTGRPMSEQASEWEGEPEDDWCILALVCPRDVLYARIEARVDRMIADGLQQEVRALLAQGVPPDAQAMQAIGYKEIVAALRGECSLNEAVACIKRNTRRYAKRQITWLKRDPRVQWVDTTDYPDAGALHGELVRRIQSHQQGESHAD